MMFGQPVIILSKPIISATILNACSALIESENRLNGCEAELVSHTHISSNSDDNIASNQVVKTQKAELSHVCQILNTVADKLNKCYENIFTKHKEEIARLSVEITRKILVHKIENNDYEIENIVKESLKNVPTSQDVEIHLNPKDLEKCQKAFQNEDDSKLYGIQFISDPNIGQAECMIKSPKGMIHAFIEEQLEQISEALKKV